MSLILTVYNSPFWKIFTNASGLALINETSPLVKNSAGILDLPQPLATLSALLSGATSDQTLWLAAVQAEHFIANALESGINVEEAAQQWEHNTKTVLDLHRKHRKNLKIFNIYQALINPTQFCEVVSPALTISSFSSHTFDDNIYLLAACQYIAQRNDLQNINTRLQACALPVCESHILHINIPLIVLQNQALHSTSQERDTILSQLNLVQEQLETQHALNSNQIASLSKERDTILSQLHLVQEQLENHHSQNSNEIASLSQERDSILSQLHGVQEQLTNHHTQNSNTITALSEERDAIIYQLHQVQEQLESHHIQNSSVIASLSKERDNTKKKHDDLLSKCNIFEKNITKLESSLNTLHKERDDALGQIKIISEALEETRENYNRLQLELGTITTEKDTLAEQAKKNAAESRKKTGDIESLKNKLDSITEERDLILHQLHNVQEQLESYYLTLQNEKKTNKHTLLARDKQQAKEVAKLESELRKTKARAASAEYAGKLLQNELEALRKTISWKAAKPVRAIGRLIKKSDPAHSKLVQEIGLLLTSEYFDVDWYLRTYTDVAECQMNPAEHYLLYGAAEGRLPGPLFDGNWYLQHYPDVAQSKLNPLLHFVMFGQQEGRASSPLLLTNDPVMEE